MKAVAMITSDDIHWLWPTYIFRAILDISKIEIHEVLRRLTETVSDQGPMRFNLDSFHPELSTEIQCSIKQHILGYLHACGENIEENNLDLRNTFYYLPAGSYRNIMCGGGNYHAIFYLACNHHPHSEKRSGKFILRDPRAGCANVFIPGLPLGRPIVMDPEPGLFIAFPSFLQFSISPLSISRWQLFLEVEIRTNLLFEGTKM